MPEKKVGAFAWTVVGLNPNLADIVAAKSSAFIVGGEMADYFARKVQD